MSLLSFIAIIQLQFYTRPTPFLELRKWWVEIEIE